MVEEEEVAYCSNTKDSFSSRKISATMLPPKFQDFGAQPTSQGGYISATAVLQSMEKYHARIICSCALVTPVDVFWWRLSGVASSESTTTSLGSIAH
jgi:hypothetical protein